MSWSSILQLAVIILFIAGPPLLRVIVELADKARQRRLLAQQQREEEMASLRPGARPDQRPPTVGQTGGRTRGATPGPPNPYDMQTRRAATSLEKAEDQVGRAARRQAELEEWRDRRRQSTSPTTALPPLAPPVRPGGGGGGAGGGGGGGGGWSVPGDSATARAEAERRRREAIEQLRRQTEVQRVEELRRRAMAEERERSAREAGPAGAQARPRGAAFAGTASLQSLSPRQIEDLLARYAAMTGRRIAVLPGATISPEDGAGRGAVPAGIDRLLGRPLEPQDLRAAIILKEVLDPPVSLREGQGGL